MRKYIKMFRVETNKGRIVGHADTVEMAEFLAHKGRRRWVFRWYEGCYYCAKKTQFVDVDEAFARAINDGRMPFLEAQMYMYMGTRDGVDMFKHVDTREYLA